MFYEQLLYVDTASGAFGLNFQLNLRWTDPRLTWPSSHLEVTTVDSSMIWTPKLWNWFAKDSKSFFEGHGRDVKLFNFFFRILVHLFAVYKWFGGCVLWETGRAGIFTSQPTLSLF